MPADWDDVVVGSGFGGSVGAPRLAEMGCRVLVLEEGPRRAGPDFAKSTWNLKLWLPGLGCRGIFRMSFVPHVAALSGVGVGGAGAKARHPEANGLTKRACDLLDGFPPEHAHRDAPRHPDDGPHPRGGPMGNAPENGVIDHRRRVFGYDGLWVVDGSAISANPGVNPSLTITVLAERAMTFVPPKEPVSGQGSPESTRGGIQAG